MTPTSVLLDNVPLNTENVSERLPVIILADTSYSMKGEPIGELLKGLEVFKASLEDNELIQDRVEILFLTFGGKVTIVSDFTSVDMFPLPKLIANGETPMGQAILVALQKIEERKKLYRVNSIDYLRPIMIMFTDGAPTDTDIWNSAVDDLIEAVVNKKVHFQAIGVEGANMEILGQMSPTSPPIKLNSVEHFKKYFQFLSKSIEAATPHEQIANNEQIADYISVHEQ